eukprot:8721533-Pyramimonas_sp.AAC.1
MPVATPAGESVQHHCPIPGTTGEPPSASTAPRHKDHDPCRPACEELYYTLISLIDACPGIWASYDSAGRKHYYQLQNFTPMMHMPSPG